jgi:hypothetical protein
MKFHMTNLNQVLLAARLKIWEEPPQNGRYVFLQLHHSTGGAEALQGKHNFERLAKESGVSIKAYRADNGNFAKSEIQNSAKNQGQVLTFCGVGAHHQNGIAERYI